MLALDVAHGARDGQDVRTGQAGGGRQADVGTLVTVLVGVQRVVPAAVIAGPAAGDFADPVLCARIGDGLLNFMTQPDRVPVKGPRLVHDSRTAPATGRWQVGQVRVGDVLTDPQVRVVVAVARRPVQRVVVEGAVADGRAPRCGLRITE